jgi:hypothetical protein
MQALGAPNSGPMPVARAFACIIVLALFDHAMSDRASGSEPVKLINTDDYFQVPADLFVHQHALVRHSEEIRSFRRLAHRIKASSGWKTVQNAELVPVDLKNVSDYFFYHSPETGAVTNISSIYQTVSDTVYFDQVPSITSVACNDSVISVQFNVSVRQDVFNKRLSFGSKCAHYAPGIRVTGGHSFFCHSSSDTANLFFRRVESVLACFDDEATGRASVLRLNTADADPLTFYDSVSDFSLNGSMALIPKRLFRSRSRVDFFQLSRQMWKERQMAAQANLRGCDSNDPANCYDTSLLLSGAYLGITYQKRASLTAHAPPAHLAHRTARSRFAPSHLCIMLTLSMQKSTCLITTTTPQRTKRRNRTSHFLAAIQ